MDEEWMIACIGIVLVAFYGTFLSGSWRDRKRDWTSSGYYPDSSSDAGWDSSNSHTSLHSSHDSHTHDHGSSWFGDSFGSSHDSGSSFDSSDCGGGDCGGGGE